MNKSFKLSQSLNKTEFYNSVRSEHEVSDIVKSGYFKNIGSTTVVTGDDDKIVHAFTYGTYGELLSGDTNGILRER